MLLDYMEYIYAVYEEKSFSKAAKRLFVSQPWLSATVKKVEQEIKAPIFNRTTSPITLTEAGKYYIEALEKVMAIQNDMKEHFEALSTNTEMQLHIGSSMFFCTYVLPKVLTDFRAEYPQITLSYSEGNTEEMLEKLRTGVLDFVLEAEPPDAATLTSTVWATEQMVLAVPASAKINAQLKSYQYSFEELIIGRKKGWCKPAITLNKFKDEEFLFLKKGNDSYKRCLKLCKNAGFTPNISSYLEQMMTAYYLVCEGRGITFLRSTIPEYVMPTDKVVFYCIDDPLALRNLYLCYRKKSTSPVQAKLLDYMNKKQLIPEELHI